ncbi:MAG: hypothetical protein ACYS3S_03045 [Planctomycetota bacterium]|jgi:hypothetical protein
MINARIDRFRYSVLLVFILFFMSAMTGFCDIGDTRGQDSITDDAGTEPVKHAIDLNYKQGYFGFAVSCKDTDRGSFEKEPDFGNSDIICGFIPIGLNQKEHIGFAWDIDGRKLYLDLNGNRDLTDDPSGVFQSDSDGRFQHFRDINLSLQKGTLNLPYVINMDMYSYGQSNHFCSASIVSNFAGEMTLHGRKWNVAVVDNMNGRIGPGDRFFIIPQDVDMGINKDRRQLNVPKNVFLDSHNYDVSFEFQPGKAEPKLQLTLTESEKPMGRLDIDGENIARLVLESDSCTVLLHHPERSVSIPTGDYRCRNIFLYDKKAGIFEYNSIRAPGTTSLSVSLDQSLTFKAGGPLDNNVEVTREGNTLNLRYKLLGAGQREYQRLQDNREKPPAFTVYCGSKKIVSDTFEYG